MYIWIKNVVQFVFELYWFVLIASALVSWIPDLQDTAIGQVLVRLTEPYLRWFRRYIPGLPLGGVVLDLSFIVALIVYYFLKQGVMTVVMALLVRSMS